MKVWGNAFRAITSVTADRLREMWEAGVERPGEPEQILKDLNATLNREVYLSCSARPWSYGSNPVKHKVDANVNAAEILSSPSAAPSQQVSTALGRQRQLFRRSSGGQRFHAYDSGVKGWGGGAL